MGQCITVNVGNKHENTAKDLGIDNSTPRDRRKKRRKQERESDEESEENGEDGLCGCVEDITGCLPCI